MRPKSAVTRHKNLPTSPHPCSTSVPNPPQSTGPTLNHTPLSPDQTKRRARHLRQCERLAELGMELAEAAHREALRDIQPRPERRASPFPGMPDLAAPFFPRDSTYGTLFAKLSRCVRQTILLEARLAAGAYDHAEPTVNGTPRAEPQRPAPQPQAPRAPENRPRLRPEQLEDDLAADASRPPAEILGEICAELGAAVEAGLSPGRPANTKLEQRPETRSAPRLSQAERATQLALQHGIPPPR